MAIVVQKFGGTSVADASRIKEVAAHVHFTRRHGSFPVVVVSAMGKETDELYGLAENVTHLRPGREMDMLITAGERKAIALICLALFDLGVQAKSFTGSQAGFITDEVHQDARIQEIRPQRIQEAIADGIVPVVAGAQGVSGLGDVTFLGRGGSDTTAVALAHAIGAGLCEIYTDVSGVFTADPRLVPTARRIAEISFDEMLEMSATGCPKPAMRSVLMARTYAMPLHIRSAFTWEPGTLVREVAEVAAIASECQGSRNRQESQSQQGSRDQPRNQNQQESQTMERPIISAVTHDASEAKVTLLAVPDRPGVAAMVFRRIADVNLDVDMIVQNVSEEGVTDISFTVSKADLAAVVENMQSIMTEVGGRGVTANSDIARVSLIGAGMKSHPGVAAQMFETLADNDINIDMITTSAIRISCVVVESDMEKAVLALHDAFDLGQAG